MKKKLKEVSKNIDKKTEKSLFAKEFNFIY
jgi:hypothetical protein